MVPRGGLDTPMVSSTSICQGPHVPFAGVFLWMFTHGNEPGPCGTAVCSSSRLTLFIGARVGHLCNDAAGLP